MFISQERMDNLFTLDSLPCEVVWIIIEFTPESVFELRLTSRYLKSMVDAYAVQTVTIPLVGKISFHRSPKYVKIYVEVPKTTSNLFELRVSLRQTPIDLSNRIECVFRSTPNRPEIMADPVVCYVLSFDPLVDNYSLLEYLSGCVGGSVAKVGVLHCADTASLAIIDNFLSGMSVERLLVATNNLSEEIGKHILAMIAAHNIECATLHVWGVSCADPVAFLLSLSSRLRSLRIRQCFLPDFSRGNVYLLGMHGADWAAIIIDMLSRKLDKLHIDNHLYPQYLPRDQADELRMRLPELGKPIWLEVSCNVYAQGLDYRSNEYLIRADGADHDKSRYLRIKHCSRVEQAF